MARAGSITVGRRKYNKIHKLLGHKIQRKVKIAQKGKNQAMKDKPSP